MYYLPERLQLYFLAMFNSCEERYLEKLREYKQVSTTKKVLNHGQVVFLWTS